MSFKKILAVVMACAMAIGAFAASALTLDVAESAAEAISEEAVLAEDYNYAEKLEELGYTFTLNGVLISEVGYYKLDGTQVETAEEANVQVTDPVNKKMKYLNGTTWQEVEKVFDLEHTEWEKEAVGVYVAGVKISETGWYNNDGSAADGEGTVYVDLENKKIVLNGAQINHVTGEMTYIEKVNDPDYPQYVTASNYYGDVWDNIKGVPGVLVVTEDHTHNSTRNIQRNSLGKANWDCMHYWMSGYTPNYKFASIALGIMTDDAKGEAYENWVLELVGENTITVENTFSKPMRLSTEYEYYLDSPAYGIFAEANLTITGTGSLDTNVDNQWDYANQGYMDHFNESTAGAVWSKGDLSINGGSITAAVSTTEIENPNYGCTITGNNTIGALGASGTVTISGSNTVVDATTTTTQGFAISSGTSVTITDNATVEAESKSAIAGAAIAGVVQNGWFGQSFPVTISNGAKVTATATSTIDNAEYTVGVGISGSTVIVENATLDVSGEAVGVNGQSVTISGGNVKVEATNENGTAVEADTAEISSGSYSTALPDDYIADGSVIIDDIVRNAIPREWAVKLGEVNYYTNVSYAQKAVDNLEVSKYADYNNVVWFNESATVSRSGLSLGDVITIYVKHGKTVDVDFTGDRLMAQLEIVEGADTGAAVLAADAVAGYDAYIYTMVVDPDKAIFKVVKQNGEIGYFNDLGSNYSANTANNFAEDGDTIILLDDVHNENSYFSIDDYITFDFNGHTLSSEYSYTVRIGSKSIEGTIIFTDNSEKGNGGIYNDDGYAVINWNSNKKTTLVFEGGVYTTAANEDILRTDEGTTYIKGGTFSGKFVEYGSTGMFEISGGRFTSDLTETCVTIADGYEIIETGDSEYYYAVGVKTTNEIDVVFEQVDGDAEGYDLYNINLVGANNEVINRLNSADLTFVLDATPVTGAAIDYEIIAVEKVTVTPDTTTPDEDRFMFNFNGKDAVVDTANSITIAQVKVSGYGTYTFSVDTANDTNVAHATKALDNIVDTFVPGGATGKGILDLNDATTGEVTIAVPVRTLTVNVAFPNSVVDNAAAYQDMKVEITGNIEGVHQTVTYDLGNDMQADGTYVVEETRLVLNETYNVVVSGAGYRTARYTVTMTDAKVLNFWNNVKDNAVEVEEGKASSAVTKNFLAGDIVGDNNINIYDLSAVVSYFATEITDEADYDKYVKYDLNRDGKIDSKDVAYVLVSWGA